MKHFFSLILPILLLLTSCNTLGDENSSSGGYISTHIEFLPNSLSNNYKITFNGQELNSRDFYTSINSPKGVIEVYSKNDNKQVFKQEINLSHNGTIKFVRPVGRELTIYSDKEYKVFFPNIKFINNDEKNHYILKLGDYVMIPGEDNYIPVEYLPDSMMIIMNNEQANKVYSRELTTETEHTLEILQLSKDLFLDASGSNNEENPAANEFKIRFFYTIEDFPNNSKLKFDLFLCDKSGKNEQFFKSIELEANKMGEYLTVPYDYYKDGSNIVNFFYDVTDQKGNKVVDHKVSNKYRVALRNTGVTYSFMTYRFKTRSPGGWSNTICTRVLQTERQ